MRRLYEHFKWKRGAVSEPVAYVESSTFKDRFERDLFHIKVLYDKVSSADSGLEKKERLLALNLLISHIDRLEKSLAEDANPHLLSIRNYSPTSASVTKSGSFPLNKSFSA